jgi:hypothetical protein
VSSYTTYSSAMLVATCNRLFQISSETRAIEIDDSIVRTYPSDTERDRESYTEVCDICLSRPIMPLEPTETGRQSRNQQAAPEKRTAPGRTYGAQI